MPKNDDQDTVIQKFVTHLSKIRHTAFTVIAWPDKVKGSSREIDAIAKGKDTRIAIEHTTIDTILHQRKDSIRFMKVFGETERELNGKLPDRVRLTVPFYAIPTGVHWSVLKQTLKNWLLEKIPTLPYGHAYQEYDVLGLPFKINIQKKPSKKPSFRVARFPPKDINLSERLGDAINKKVKKLISYKDKGYQTILLIENSDIALMNLGLMEESVNAVFIKNLPSGLDEIWYADTSVSDEFRFYLVWPKKPNT